MDLCLINFIGVSPVVDQVTSSEVGYCSTVFHTVSIGHWDEIKVYLPFH